jgi:transposase
MWLSGNNRPDFRTINNFRSSRLKDFIDTVFGSTLELLIEAKLVKIEDYFQDGTTLEADANKHSYVWKKNVERYKGKLQNRIKDLIKKIDEINEAEDKEYGERDLEEMGEESTITSEKIKQKVDEINRKMKEITDKTKAKQTESLSKKLNKEYLPKLQKYENQQKILGKRNSYSRTDPDATFIRLKGNGFGNKELKPAYNIQIGTENQFIVGYSVHQNASDSVTMISHLEKLKGILGKVLPSSQRKLPLNIITDAGYGSEENYQYLESEKMQGYVKYNMFDLEKTKKYKENKFRTENLQYDDQKDEYICPNNKVLRYIKTVTSKSATGYQSEKRLYQCENCDGCELRSLCHKSKDNRIIQQSQTLNNYRAKARSLLETDIGKQFSKKRSIEVESVFGDIKRNRSFERFNLRGTEKVNSELGLVSIAHNMIKVWRTKINEGLMKKLVFAN